MNRCRTIAALFSATLISLVVAITWQPAAADLTAEINPTTGSVLLRSVGTTDFQGYELTENIGGGSWETSDIRWSSVVDQSAAIGWVELSGGDLLAEALFSGSDTIVLNDGDVLELGTPYEGPSDVLENDFGFSYVPAGTSDSTAGSVSLVPEPHGGLLLAGGFAAWTMKRRRSARRHSSAET